MNCQEVEAIIADLARGVASDQQALAHVKKCPRCGERLAEEESLTMGLAAWAEVSSGEQKWSKRSRSGHVNWKLRTANCCTARR